MLQATSLRATGVLNVQGIATESGATAAHSALSAVASEIKTGAVADGGPASVNVADILSRELQAQADSGNLDA